MRLHLHPNDQAEVNRSELLKNLVVDDMDVSWWRFSHWVERELVRHLKKEKKNNLNMQGFVALDKYLQTVNGGVFFSSNVNERIRTLYKIFQDNPHISKKLANEFLGKNYEDEHESIPREIYAETFYSAQLTPVTLTSYVEHRARLAVLKSAVDLCLFEENAVHERAPAGVDVKGATVSYRKILPGSFICGLEEIKDDPYFHAYPLFWQHFLWFFGGFILVDRLEDEYKLFSEKTGIPVEEIPRALEAYDKLFPTTDGWFYGPSSTSNIRMLKMMCCPFMGIGANVRRCHYSDVEGFEEMGLTGKHTVNDLRKWNNLGVSLLE